MSRTNLIRQQNYRYTQKIFYGQCRHRLKKQVSKMIYRNIRRDKIIERQYQQRDKIDKINRQQYENTKKPKSLEIQIADRKRTLSKYLNDKNVEKFIQMQNQYGTKSKDSIQNKFREDHRLTPQAHKLEPTKRLSSRNQYELNRLQSQNSKKNQMIQKQLKSFNDSFDKFAEQQKYHNDYMRSNESLLIQKGRNSQKIIPNNYQEMEYELYHNGKGIQNLQIKAADHLLQEQKKPQTSRNSSNSSKKVVGTIRSKKSPIKETINQSQIEKQMLPIQIPGTLRKKQRVNSCQSYDNQQQIREVKLINTEYHTRNIQNTQQGWQTDSKSTRRQEKGISYGDRNQSQTLQKILETFQNSNPKYQQVNRVKQKVLNIEKQRLNHSPERIQRVETYYCKIHEDQQIIYFCLKCNQLICSQCALHGSHKTHEIHSLKKSAMILRQSLAHNTNILTKLLIQQQSKQKILKQCLNQINLQCSRQKQQIRSSFENFIFHIDKKYKELLKDIEEKFSAVMAEYSEKLIQSRNSYIQISKIKDSVCDTLQQCSGFEDGAVSQTNIGAACNQLGNFHIKKPKNKQFGSNGISYINKLMSRIQELQQFLKSSNMLLFSDKKESLLSENSSLKLSQSSNLLEQKDSRTPDTVTPQGRSAFVRTPIKEDKRNKKIVVSSYSLNVRSRIKISQCDALVQSLVQMQQIIKSIKPEWIQYELRSLI